MISLPYSIEKIKNGDPKAIEWVMNLTQKELDVIQYECNCNEEDSTGIEMFIKGLYTIAVIVVLVLIFTILEKFIKKK